MQVKLYSPRELLVGSEDRAILDSIQCITDGNKIRNKNQIIIPLKSSSKLLKYDKNIEWLDNTRTIAVSIYNNTIKRKKNIDIIRKQYGSGRVSFDYEYKGIYKPMEHQKVIFNTIAYCDIASILADVGTCKTGPYIWAIDKRIQKGQVKKCLVITLSHLKQNILDEIKLQAPHLKGVILDGKAQSDKILNKKFKKEEKNLDYDIYIANYESMFSLTELFSEDYFQMVVLDEAHRIGSPSSRQTKCIIEHFEFTKYKYIVTGTLHANNLMSFYMPFRFLGPDTVPYANYYEFRRMFMFPVDPDQYIWIPSKGAELEVRKIVGDVSISFKKEDCIDLPELIRETSRCDMSSDQYKLYTQLSKDFITIVEDMCSKCNKSGNCDRSCENGEIAAKNALTMAGKLRQIASGFYINTKYRVTEDGRKINESNIITLNENPKLELLINTINNIPEDRKVIIWTNYIHSVELIANRLSKAFDSKSVLTCYQNQDAYKQVELFKNKQYLYMVANPGKMGTGLNIQFSSYQIFFSNSYSWIQRDQAEGRQYRQGQKDKVTVIDLITNGTIDEEVLKTLLNKKDFSISLSQLAQVIKEKV